jgi:hypothetical protein
MLSSLIITAASTSRLWAEIILEKQYLLHTKGIEIQEGLRP